MPQYVWNNMKYAVLAAVWALALAVSAQNALDAQGRRTGPWSAKYPNGQPRYAGQFSAGVPVGTFTYYHDNGFRSAEMAYRGTTGVCLSKQYDEKGKLMAVGRYGADRQKDSLWVTFAFDGTKLEEVTYVAGQRQGAYVMYYPNGKVMERGTYLDDAKTGTWVRYRETGAKERMSSYRAGRLEGKWTEFDEDGRTAVIGTYVNDLRHGTWTIMEGGAVVRTEVYRRGMLEKPTP